uniref:Uncharacterized protein n=1 Tax=viral metagenome TaxID=1070528 RepID=A0A6M3KIQ0_9ZZZZ
MPRLCPECGVPMHRKHKRTYRKGITWLCDNPDCSVITVTLSYLHGKWRRKPRITVRHDALQFLRKYVPEDEEELLLEDPKVEKLIRPSSFPFPSIAERIRQFEEEDDKD